MEVEEDPVEEHPLSAAESLIPLKETCTYTKCYCEENVWKLCDYVRTNHPTDLSSCFCVFISNPKEAAPIWHQSASHHPDYPVVWDYHVIFVLKSETGSVVYDLDTKLAFPIEFDVYMAHAIRLDEAIKPEYHRFFRVVPAEVFLQKFCCDRSHMKKPDQSWMSPPPDYPCIMIEGIDTNLKTFISMTPDTGHGTVMNLTTFVETFGDLNEYRTIAMQHYQRENESQ